MLLQQDVEPTIFIVDDDDAMRESLDELISAMRLKTRCFESAESFLQAYNSDCLGCVILDIHMPGMNGIELQDYLISVNSQLPIIIITGHGDIAMCADAIKKGAIDFLEKPYRPVELRTKIHDAVSLAREKHQAKQKRHDLRKRFSSLNHEELCILKGTVAGKLNKEIAEELDICSRTVQMRRKTIMKKLGVERRVDLIRLVISNFEHS